MVIFIGVTSKFIEIPLEMIMLSIDSPPIKINHNQSYECTIVNFAYTCFFRKSERPFRKKKLPFFFNYPQIPVHFNGKATGIYHWNIPTLKKMFGGASSRSNSKKYRQKITKLRHNDVQVDDLIDIKNTPTWSKSPSIKWHENETIDKHTQATSSNSIGKNDIFNIHGLDDDERLKVLKKKSSPSYYAPAKKQNFHKYFPSNGKPKSFYIIENNVRKADQNKKPVSYHNLIL